MTTSALSQSLPEASVSRSSVTRSDLAEDQTSAGARSAPASLLHSWNSSGHALAAPIHAMQPEG
jgi:hypothetical protein